MMNVSLGPVSRRRYRKTRSRRRREDVQRRAAPTADPVLRNSNSNAFTLGRIMGFGLDPCTREVSGLLQNILSQLDVVLSGEHLRRDTGIGLTSLTTAEQQSTNDFSMLGTFEYTKPIDNSEEPLRKKQCTQKANPCEMSSLWPAYESKLQIEKEEIRKALREAAVLRATALEQLEQLRQEHRSIHYKQQTSVQPPTSKECQPIPVNEIPVVSNEKQLICGVEVTEPILWTKLRKQSERVVENLVSLIPSPPSNRIEDSLRCYCSRTDTLSPEQKGRVVAVLRRSGTPFIKCFDSGVECTVCSFRDHVDCAIAWASSIPNNDINRFSSDLLSFMKSYVCISCRVILVEPFTVVDKVLDLRIFHGPADPAAPPPTDPNGVIGKSIQLGFDSTPAIKDMLSTGKASLQIRGFEVNSLSYRFSGFPHQTTFSFTTSHPGHKDFVVTIKPPVQHRKRKEAPCDISPTFIGSHNTIKAEMLFLNSNATACYMFAVVLVHRISSCSILNSIQCGSVIPFEIARRLSLSLLDEANRIEEDDEVQQITESHHITLTCPSTLMRMEFPGRGFRCLHTQCFDVYYYVESQKIVPSHRHRWKCPVCDKPCQPHELFIDSYFKSILDKTTENDRKAYLDAKDGNISWRVTETVEPETELIEDQDGIHDVIKSDNEDENTSNVNRRIPESVFVDID